jgi:hypothetical protein
MYMWLLVSAAPPPADTNYGTGGPEIPEDQFNTANNITDELYRVSKLVGPCYRLLPDATAALACVENLQANPDDKETMRTLVTLPASYETDRKYRSKVYDQKGCNTCVTYAAMDNCETNWRVTSKPGMQTQSA